MPLCSLGILSFTVSYAALDNVFTFQFTVVDTDLMSSSIHLCIPLKSQCVDPINTINNDNDTVDGNGEIERDIVY